VVNAFQFAVGNEPLPIVGPNLERAVLLLALLRAALRDGTVVAPSFNGIALSLNRPRETVRRAGLGLVDLGLCVKSVRGIRLAPDFLDRPDMRLLRARVLRLFFVLLDRFEWSGFALPKDARAVSEDASVVAALDIYLSVFELTESRMSEPIVLHVLAAVTVGNAARIVDHPVLAMRYGYAETVPPDELRVPISLKSVVALSGLPYSTLWRHAVALEKAGLLRKTAGGYLLGDVFMNSAQTSARSVEKIKYVRRVLHDLASGR